MYRLRPRCWKIIPARNAKLITGLEVVNNARNSSKLQQHFSFKEQLPHLMASKVKWWMN